MSPNCIASLAAVLILSNFAPARGGEVSPEKIVFRGKSFTEWRALLQHSEPKLRQRAATALGLGSFGKQAVPELIKVLLDGDKEVVESTLAALCCLGPNAAEAIPAVVRLTKVHEHENSAFAVLLSIGMPALPVLLEHMRTEELVDGDLLPAIGKMGPAVIKPVLPLLTDQTANVRGRAALILGHVGSEAAGSVPELFKLLKDPDEVPRGCALEALGQIGAGNEKVIRKLVQTLKSEEDGGLAALALVRIGMAAMPALRRSLKAGDSTVRELVLGALAEEGGPRGHALLLKEFPRASAPERIQIALALSARRRESGCVFPLLTAALKDAAIEDRRKLFEALGNIGPRPAPVARALGQGLLDSDEVIRTIAVESLHLDYRSCRGAALPALCEAFPIVSKQERIYILNMVTRAGPPEAKVVRLVCLSLTAADSDERRLAVAAVLRLGRGADEVLRLRGAVGDGMDVEARPIADALRKILKSPDPYLSEPAAVALWLMTGRADEALPVLRPILCPSDQPRKHVVSLESLCVLAEMSLKNPDALALLLETLKPGDGLDAEIVAEVLVRDPAVARKAFPVLKKAIKVGNNCDRGRLFQVLVHGGAEAVTLFRELLRRGSWEQQVQVCRVLPDLGKLAEEAVPDVIPLLQSASVKVPEAALACLNRLGPLARTAVPAITELLLDRRDDIRAKAFRALARIAPKDREAVAALQEGLTDPSPAARAAAVEALGRASAHSALPALERLIGDKEGRVRAAAALACWRLGSPKEKVLPLLRDAVRGGDSQQRLAAAIGLWEIERSHSVVVHFLRLLEEEDRDTNEDEEIRVQAAAQLREMAGECKEVITDLFGVLDSPSEAARRQATTLLCELAPARLDAYLVRE